jgi:hypothetical protein
VRLVANRGFDPRPLRRLFRSAPRCPTERQGLPAHLLHGGYRTPDALLGANGPKPVRSVFARAGDTHVSGRQLRPNMIRVAPVCLRLPGFARACLDWNERLKQRLVRRFCSPLAARVDVERISHRRSPGKRPGLPHEQYPGELRAWEGGSRLCRSGVSAASNGSV